MQNGNKVTKKNWHKVYAVASNPCTNVLGVPAIEAAKANGGQYFEKWKLVYEKSTDDRTAGYIFREINHNGGISGRHKTYKEAIWSAIKPTIKVFIED